MLLPIEIAREKMREEEMANRRDKRRKTYGVGEGDLVGRRGEENRREELEGSSFLLFRENFFYRYLFLNEMARTNPT